MRNIWMTAAFLVPLATISEVAADQPTRPADPKGSSGSAAVSDAEMSIADRFAAIDTDGDGQIDQGEARAALERLFARMDEDQSGYLSADEFSGFHLPTRANPDQKAFDEVDLDGDGRVEAEEYLETGVARFRATDVDGDAGISLSEYAAVAR
jgi:EF-hand domain pair/EF hand